MNRLNDYFKVVKMSKLARLHLIQAKEHLDKGRLDKGAAQLYQAIDVLLVSLNNVARIACKTKP